MKHSRLGWLVSFFALCAAAHAQVILSGTSYTENFNSVGSGLPTGWTVSTNAALNTLGTSTTFTTTATTWNSTGGTSFRNISSNNVAVGAASGIQSGNANRALGLRPLTAGDRDGAVTVEISNTTGFKDFSLSVDLFTGNDVTANQTYALEYRIGNSGNFTSIGTYTTGVPFNATTLTANSITLAALNDQSSSVFFRIRGTTGTGSGNLDTLGIDNFSLTFASTASAIPEPSTYAAILGGVALVGVLLRRRARAAAVVGL